MNLRIGNTVLSIPVTSFVGWTEEDIEIEWPDTPPCWARIAAPVTPGPSERLDVAREARHRYLAWVEKVQRERHALYRGDHFRQAA